MTLATTTKQDHILIFPFLSKGHTIPLLHLATSLSTHNNIFITLITTQSNLPFFLDNLPSSLTNLDLLLLPFPPHPSLPAGVESTDYLPSSSLFPAFLSATASLQNPFLNLLTNLLLSPSPPLCLISDYFLSWTLPICHRFRLPRLVFHGMSAFSMSLCKSLWRNIPKDDFFTVPGTPPDLRLSKFDVPTGVLNSVDLLHPHTVFLDSIGVTDVGSWGVIVNSFVELEPPAYVRLLESFYRPVAGGRVWLIGPLNLLSVEMEKGDNSECIKWLDRQPDGSVVYVAFGTQAEVSDEQLDEVAHGLVQARVRFLWAVRSKTWVAPKDVGDFGRVESGWVPQMAVLSHAAVGGFVSHCGWNSVLEAVSAGVPVLTLPMMAEQGLNAKMVADVIGVGLRIRAPAPLPEGAAARVVVRKEVEEGVRELMEGEKGRRVRERVAEMKEKAKAAIAVGGSSYDTIQRLLDELRNIPAAVVVAEEDMMKVEEDMLKGEVMNLQRELRHAL